MSNFTKEDVQYFADFARLALTEEEKVAYAEQLQQMVELTAKLKDVNTEGGTDDTSITSRERIT